jgi:hypothetical protein
MCCVAVRCCNENPCLLRVLAAPLPEFSTWFWNHSEDQTTASKLLLMLRLNLHNNALKMTMPGEGEMKNYFS